MHVGPTFCSFFFFFHSSLSLSSFSLSFCPAIFVFFLKMKSADAWHWSAGENRLGYSTVRHSLPGLEFCCFSSWRGNCLIPCFSISVFVFMGVGLWEKDLFGYWNGVMEFLVWFGFSWIGYIVTLWELLWFFYPFFFQKKKRRAFLFGF